MAMQGMGAVSLNGLRANGNDPGISDDQHNQQAFDMGW